MKPTKLMYVTAMVLLLSACADWVKQGVPGTPGSPGLNGNKGNDGTPGTGGEQGAPGLNVVSQVISAPYGACPNGGSILLLAQDELGTGVWDITDPGQSAVLICNGPDGAKGDTGETGSQGMAGQDGSNGINATPITPVQFCPNLGTTVYASNWPEQGFCLDNKLYGVYFTGSYAFLAELPPGAYSSTSMNGCSFTIGSNCSVTQQ